MCCKICLDSLTLQVIVNYSNLKRMKTGQERWTIEQLQLVLNLYYKTPFGRLHKGNPDVIALAKRLNRTPSAVAYKLVNFASLDPALQARGIKGAANSSKLDKQVWDDFFENIEALAFATEAILDMSVDEPLSGDVEVFSTKTKEGFERMQTIMARVNQDFFRSTVMASYNYTCCITGIQQPELLIAGHIKPWSIDEKNRMNPSNGIAINALHDKAFEQGLMTITPDYRIRISSKLYADHKKPRMEEYFLRYDNEDIIKPTKFLPDPALLIYHNENRFIP